MASTENTYVLAHWRLAYDSGDIPSCLTLRFVIPGISKTIYHTFSYLSFIPGIYKILVTNFEKYTKFPSKYQGYMYQGLEIIIDTGQIFLPALIKIDKEKPFKNSVIFLFLETQGGISHLRYKLGLSAEFSSSLQKIADYLHNSSTVKEPKDMASISGHWGYCVNSWDYIPPAPAPVGTKASLPNPKTVAEVSNLISSFVSKSQIDFPDYAVPAFKAKVINPLENKHVNDLVTTIDSSYDALAQESMPYFTKLVYYQAKTGNYIGRIVGYFEEWQQKGITVTPYIYQVNGKASDYLSVYYCGEQYLEHEFPSVALAHCFAMFTRICKNIPDAVLKNKTIEDGAVKVLLNIKLDGISHKTLLLQNDYIPSYNYYKAFISSLFPF